MFLIFFHVDNYLEWNVIMITVSGLNQAKMCLMRNEKLMFFS
jgi:hypothetical protein